MSTTGSGVRRVDFNKLPPELRERVVACTKGGAWPTPIVQQQLGRGGTTVGFVLLAVLGAAIAGGVALMDYGRPRAPGQSPAFIAAYGLGFFLAIYAVLAIVRRFKLVRALPYPPGRYLFPVDFVDARTNVLRIVPMSSLVDFRGVHQHYNGVYSFTLLTFRFEGGIKETFQVRAKALAETLLDQLRSSQYALRQAVQSRDVARIAALDLFMAARLEDKWEVAPEPFADLRNPSTGSGLTAQALPGWLAWASLPALAIGAALAVPSWLVRNSLADAAAFARASRGEIYDLEAYVAGQGRRADEVTRRLLPAKAFEEAKERGSVTALREVLATYPEAEVAPEVRAEIHRLFEKTLADFRAQAATDDPALEPFMVRLFALLESRDAPTVQVRFRKPSTEALQGVDDEARKEYGTSLMPIAGHFTDQKMLGREDTIVTSLGQAFARIFPADVLSLQKGARAHEKLAGSEVRGPVIEIGYDVSPSGSVYEEEESNRKAIGIEVAFQVSMRLPGETKSLDFALNVQPPQHFTVETSRYGGGVDLQADPSQVYAVMAARAFDQLDTKLRAVFFKSAAPPESDLEPPTAPVPPPRRPSKGTAI